MAGPIGTVSRPGVGMSVSQYKNSFFDREGLRLSVADGLEKAKSKFGAFLARRMKSNIRNRGGKTSKPGQTPTNQVGTLKEFIFFARDPGGTVVVGPAKTNQKNFQGYGGKTGPQILEQGGLIRIFEHQLPNIPDIFGDRAGTWVRSDFRYGRQGPTRSAVGRPRRVRWAKIEARPFVKVSAEKELATGKHSELLRGVIRKS